MSEEPTTSVSVRRSVTKDELLQLYQSVKSAETITLYDAAEALGHGDVATACEKLNEAKLRYERKHTRALSRNPDSKASARQQEKSAARRRKIEDAMQKFAEYHAALEKIVKINRAKPSPKADGATLVKLQASKKAKVVEPRPDVLQRFRAVVETGEALEFLKTEYELLPLHSAKDVAKNSLYVVRSKQNVWHLLRSPLQGVGPDSVSFHSFQAKKDISVAMRSLLSAAKLGHAFRLRQLQANRDQIVLDESELNVLWAVIRDTKLLPNASEITMIKKNELRRKQYDRALKKMLLLQRSFNSAASSKRSDFRRELAMLAEQKQNMSLREVEKRKLKIAQETRLLERADAHFVKVMNSLHALNSRLS